MICEILLDEVPSFMCAIKCQPPSKSTNTKNSRKIRGREKLSQYYKWSGSACSSLFQVLILTYFWTSGRRVFGYHMITGDMIWHGFGMKDMSSSWAKWVKQPKMNSYPWLSYGDTGKSLFGEKSSSHFYIRLFVQIFNLPITLDSTQIFQSDLLFCYINLSSLNARNRNLIVVAGIIKTKS